MPREPHPSACLWPSFEFGCLIESEVRRSPPTLRSDRSTPATGTKRRSPSPRSPAGQSHFPFSTRGLYGIYNMRSGLYPKQNSRVFSFSSRLMLTLFPSYPAPNVQQRRLGRRTRRDVHFDPRKELHSGARTDHAWRLGSRGGGKSRV